MLDLGWQPIQRLNWKVSGGLQQCSFLATEDKDKEVPYIPSLFVDGEITIGPFRGLTTHIRGRYEGKRFATDLGDELDAYSLVGVQLSKTWGKRIRLFLGGSNLLDETYALWQGYEMPGITGYIGLEGRW